MIMLSEFVFFWFCGKFFQLCDLDFRLVTGYCSQGIDECPNLAYIFPIYLQFLSSFEPCPFFKKLILVDTCYFMGPQIPLFLTSGDISSRFQSQCGQPYSHLAEVYMMYVP